MSLEINLSVQTEKRLRATAEERGIEISELIEALVATLPPAKSESVSPQKRKKYQTAEEKIRALNALAQRHPTGPVLPPDTFDRENLYADVDERVK